MELINCTNCAKPLGTLIPLFDHLVDEIKQNAMIKTKAEPRKLPFLKNFMPELQELLDILHIENECCRTAMICKVRMI